MTAMPWLTSVRAGLCLPGLHPGVPLAAKTTICMRTRLLRLLQARMPSMAEHAGTTSDGSGLLRMGMHVDKRNASACRSARP